MMSFLGILFALFIAVILLASSFVLLALLKILDETTPEERAQRRKEKRAQEQRQKERQKKIDEEVSAILKATLTNKK